MISSPHGRAVQHLSEVLTSEAQMTELFNEAQLKGWGDRLPEGFQIVLSVTVLDDELSAPGHVDSMHGQGSSHDVTIELGRLGRCSRRVSFRVSLRWQNPQTEANGRKPTKEFANAKSLAPYDLSERSLFLLAFREMS